MLRFLMRPPCGVVLLACGLHFSVEADHGLAPSAQAQTRDPLVGLSARSAPARPDRHMWGAAAEAAAQDMRADRELQLARNILALGDVLQGRRRLEVLVARYPEAAASDQARRELARLYAQSAGAMRRANVSSRSGDGVGTGESGRGRVPVSLGAPVPIGTLIPAQGSRTERPQVPRAVAQDFRLYVGDRVFFGERSAELSAQALSLLAGQARWLKQVPQVLIVIEGHADEDGGAAFNHELAARRAQAVRDRLVADGVDAGRITTESHGRQRPVALCSDGGECAAQNRRVVTVLRGARSAAEALDGL